MSQANKTCFVISPIGEDGSSVRTAADDLYDLVIKVALEPFDFDVVRADKLPGSGQITSEIIRLVQTAELCVIDLTGHNANVYYECGRRHETGKPFVQLLNKGETLPFDLAGIRTIMYSLEDPRTVLGAVTELRRYAAEFERNGYGPSQSGVSITTIASALERLERKIDRWGLSEVQVGTEMGGTKKHGIERLLENPRQQLLNALATGQYQPALEALLSWRERMGQAKLDMAGPAAILAHAGSTQAAKIVEEILATHLDSMAKYDIINTTFGSLVEHHIARDTESDGYDAIADHSERILRHPLVRDDPSRQAFFLNQVQKVAYGAGRYKEALEGVDRALELRPDETSYMYNRSLILSRLGRDEDALDQIDQYVAVAPDTKDTTHIMHAIEEFATAGRIDDAAKLLARLKELTPVSVIRMRVSDEALIALGEEPMIPSRREDQ